MAGQSVLYEVSPELKVILVTGLFVPGGKDHYCKCKTDFGNNTKKKDTYKRQEMSLTKNLTLKKRTKVAVGTFFQLSGATLEILMSLSTKKKSLSVQRIEKRTKLVEYWIPRQLLVNLEVFCLHCVLIHYKAIEKENCNSLQTENATFSSESSIFSLLM